MTIGKRLRALRATQDITQADMADIVGKSVSAYKLWENDVNEPNINSLIFISDFFNVSIDYLVGRDAVSDRKSVEPDEMSLDVKYRGAYAETMHKICMACNISHFLDIYSILNAHSILSDYITEIYSLDKWHNLSKQIASAAHVKTLDINMFIQDYLPGSIKEIRDKLTSPLERIIIPALIKAIQYTKTTAEDSLRNDY